VAYTGELTVTSRRLPLTGLAVGWRAGVALGLLLVGGGCCSPVAPKPSRPSPHRVTPVNESGKVAPVIDRIYPLRQASEAIRYLEVEHARAKVVITL
jgi:NADPH:quinone reductase-like Zn-dependent oxidoreductase